MNRQEDLSKVFDRTWSANHNDTAQRGRERERQFMNKMFNVKEKDEVATPKIMTPGDRASNLQNNINGMANFANKTRIGNIVKKWK